MSDPNYPASAPHSPPPTHEIRAKRQWPPDMTKLSASERYRLERKYKRRIRKGYGPTWMRVTGVMQLMTVTVLPAYMVLFMDWGDMKHPFGPLRAWMWDKIGQFPGAGGSLERGTAIVGSKTSQNSEGSSSSR